MYPLNSVSYFLRLYFATGRFILIGGPSGNENKHTSGNSTLLVIISLVFGGVILAMTIAIIVGKLKKRVRQRGTEVVKDI